MSRNSTLTSPENLVMLMEAEALLLLLNVNIADPMHIATMAGHVLTGASQPFCLPENFCG